MEFENILDLIKIVSDSNVSEFEFEQNGTRVSVKKNEKIYCEPAPVTASAKTVSTQKVNSENGIEDLSFEEKEGWYIKSPLVGRFYIAPDEDAEPFVMVGDSVKKGQTVAIVEAMKLMNDIESDCDGVIAEILVENGAAVEYGQPLFKVK